VRQRGRQTIVMLGRFPHFGHDGVVSGTFEIVVPRLPFVIVYRIDVGGTDDELVILRVYHGAQDRSG